MKLLVGFAWHCLNVCRRVICGCPGVGCGLLFQELDKRFDVAIRQTQVWHAYFFIFLKQRNRGGIMFRNQLVGLLDEAFKPCAITRTGDAQEIRTDFFTVSNGVAGGAVSSENVLSRIQFHRLGFSISSSSLCFLSTSNC